ncbi:hypothetical protein B0H63DRAFT_403051 [Podospora didyma]|uniref:Signal transduction histidine-protein kinase n=1 Tax=Podospora didyma TaxID=330526 RepID=A0AAE0N4F2_9PEZI|nr:hypothetical protein B0H63DRAFT_403051 [Podospora didyma]
MLRLSTLLAACLSLGSVAVAAPTAAAATCDRDFLKAQVAAYIAAQTAGKVDTLTTSSSGVNYTQNFKTASLSTGILATPFKIDYNRSTYDTTQCATFSELVITTNPTHVIGTQMRFTDGVLSKMETIVTSTGDWLFNPANTAKYAKQEAWTEIPEAKRDTRAVIQAAADAYLDLFNDKSVKVPWGNPCARLEGGSYIQPSCNVGVPSGIKNINRRYVVDEVLGSADVFFSFGGNDPDSHEFRVESGKLRYVHTMTVMKPEHRTGRFLPATAHVRPDCPTAPRVTSMGQVAATMFTSTHLVPDDHSPSDGARAHEHGHTFDPTSSSSPSTPPPSLPTVRTLTIADDNSDEPTRGRDHPSADLIFDLTPLPMLILTPSCAVSKASARFLADFRVDAGDIVGKPLLPFLTTHLQPSQTLSARHVIATIDDAISARAERTSKPINSLHASSWTARALPVFKGEELLAVFLEWHEGPQIWADQELFQPGLSNDEAFRILVEAVKDYAIFLLDTKGHIATWNTGAGLLKGYTREEIIGRHFSIFYGKDDLAIKKPEVELEICLREGRVEDEGWRYKKDGSRFWANVVITAVYKNGVHVGFGKVTRDLTERKSAESRLISAYEESEKLKSDFLANMSHEIRTPMHGILSACSLLLDTNLDDRQRDIISIMDESGQVLLQVINDILDYSKLASGSFSITSDIVGVSSIVSSVVRSVQPTLSGSVYFELFLASDLPKSVQGDPLRYRQILQNLISNAAKFTEKGSIRVRASIQSEDEDSYMVLTEVADTGIGVEESAAASLFTPFTQFDATTTKRYKGTGLGLSIAKSLAELMEGRIGYRPNTERLHGSIFWFTAKFKKIKSLEQIQDWKRQNGREGSPMPAPQPTDQAAMQKKLREASPTKSLLLVEDNVINQKVMLGLLRSLGFRNVALASNGAEAVKEIRGKPAAYDLVLMDVNMPILDGHEASSRIRDSGIHVPIVAMTAYALKGDRERCLEHGMNDYIPKPVDKKFLVKTLCKWLLREPDTQKPDEEAVGVKLPVATKPFAPGYRRSDQELVGVRLPVVHRPLIAPIPPTVVEPLSILTPTVENYFPAESTQPGGDVGSSQ